jgi:predicted transport protein
MSDELVAAAEVPESPNAVLEQGFEIIESLQTLPTVEQVLQEISFTDYAAAVVMQQIESLRSSVNDLDRRYANNVRKHKITFKNQVSYMAVREKIASRIVYFLGSLREIRSAYPTTGTDPSEVNSWDPDADQGPEFSKPAQ